MKQYLLITICCSSMAIQAMEKGNSKKEQEELRQEFSAKELRLIKLGEEVALHDATEIIVTVKNIDVNLQNLLNSNPEEKTRSKFQQIQQCTSSIALLAPQKNPIGVLMMLKKLIKGNAHTAGILEQRVKKGKVDQEYYKQHLSLLGKLTQLEVANRDVTKMTKKLMNKNTNLH